MKTTPPTRKEDVKDPIGVTGWPKDKGRDGERTPMQWDTSTNAGFSNATPWLPVPPNYTTINVKTQQSDPNSLLSWYKALIHLKKSNDAIANGDNIMLDKSNPSVLSWIRSSGSNRVLVVVNFTAQPQSVNLSTPDIPSKSLTTLLKTPGATDSTNISKIELGPYGVYIGQL